MKLQQHRDGIFKSARVTQPPRALPTTCADAHEGISGLKCDSQCFEAFTKQVSAQSPGLGLVLGLHRISLISKGPVCAKFHLLAAPWSDLRVSSGRVIGRPSNMRRDGQSVRREL